MSDFSEIHGDAEIERQIDRDAETAQTIASQQEKIKLIGISADIVEAEARTLRSDLIEATKQLAASELRNTELVQQRADEMKRFDEWVKTTAQQHEQLARELAASEARCERLKEAAMVAHDFFCALSVDQSWASIELLAQQIQPRLKAVIDESPSAALTKYCEKWGVSWEQVKPLFKALVDCLENHPSGKCMCRPRLLATLTQLRNKE